MSLDGALENVEVYISHERICSKNFDYFSETDC